MKNQLSNSIDVMACLTLLLLLCMPSRAAAQEKLQINLNHNEIIGEKLVPIAVQKAGKVFGLNVFDFSIEGLPKTFLGKKLIKVPLVGECVMLAWLQLSDVDGSLGVDRESFQLEFAAGPRVDINYQVPARLKARVRIDALGCFLDDHITFDITVKDFIGHFNSALSVQDGTIRLNDARDFQLTLGDLVIKKSGGSDFVDIIDQVLGAVAGLGGPGRVDTFLQSTVMALLNADGNQETLRDLLLEAIQGAINDPLSFGGDVGLAGFALNVSADLASAQHLEPRGLTTSWEADVIGGAAHECADGLVYQQQQGANAHPTAGDLAVNLPTWLMEKALYEVVKQGDFCDFGFPVPFECRVPGSDDVERVCFPVNVDGEEVCADVFVSGGDGSAFDVEQLILTLGFEGMITVAPSQDGSTRVVVTFPFKVGVQDSGGEMHFLLVNAEVGAEIRVTAANTLVLSLDPVTTRIVVVDGLDDIDEYLCGQDPDFLIALINQRIRDSVSRMPSVPVTPSVTVLDGCFRIDLDSRNIDATATSMYLPFNLNWSEAGCSNEVETHYDCNGSDFDWQRRQCYFDTMPMCTGGTSLIMNYTRPTPQSREFTQDMCVSRNWGTWGNQYKPYCGGKSTDYILQRGWDSCRNWFDAEVTYSLAE